MPKVVCDYCGGVEFEYSLMDIFTHWEFPYVLCPFCGDVIIVKGDISKIFKKPLLWSSLSFKKGETGKMNCYSNCGAIMGEKTGGEDDVKC